MEGDTLNMDEAKIDKLKVDEVKSEQGKTEDVKSEEVKDNSTDAKAEPPAAPPTRMEKLQFKDLPFDMKKMIFSYVRSQFPYSCSVLVDCLVHVSQFLYCCYN